MLNFHKYPNRTLDLETHPSCRARFAVSLLSHHQRSYAHLYINLLQLVAFQCLPQNFQMINVFKQSVQEMGPLIAPGPSFVMEGLSKLNCNQRGVFAH